MASLDKEEKSRRATEETGNLLGCTVFPLGRHPSLSASSKLAHKRLRATDAHVRVCHHQSHDSFSFVCEAIHAPSCAVLQSCRPYQRTTTLPDTFRFVHQEPFFLREQLRLP
jgi:hypothetical protein